MTRPCFIGNSHLACIKLAADRDPTLIPGGNGADWFAGSATSIGGLRLEEDRWLAPPGRRLRAQMTAISGGLGRIDLAGYDLFVIAGVGLDYRSFFRLFAYHCLFEDVAHGRQFERAPISASLFRAFLADIEMQQPAGRIARTIRAANPAAKILIMCAPYPSETILDHPKASGKLSRLKGSDCFTEMELIHLAAARRAAEAAGAKLVPQGPKTQSAAGFTRACYNREAVGLQPSATANTQDWFGPKHTYDPWHMNVEFGRSRLIDLARTLEVT